MTALKTFCRSLDLVMTSSRWKANLMRVGTRLRLGLVLVLVLGLGSKPNQKGECLVLLPTDC